MKTRTYLLIATTVGVLMANTAVKAADSQSEQDYIRYVFTYQYDPGMDTALQAYASAEQQIRTDLNKDIQTQAYQDMTLMAASQGYASNDGLANYSFKAQSE